MAKPIISGIYKITNMINGKVYIGQAIDIYDRWGNERRACKKNSKHPERINRHLRASILKYGIENFKWEIINDCGIDGLNFWEPYYIAVYDAQNRDKGYNLDSGGGAGRRHCQETKDRIRMKLVGVKKTPEHCENIKKAWENASDEFRDSIKNTRRVNQTGKKHTPEAIEKIAKSSKGRRHSPETCAKMSASHTGVKLSKETRAKQSYSARHRKKKDLVSIIS